MLKFLEEVKRWFDSDVETKLELDQSINDFSQYSIQNDIFFYGKNNAIKNLTRLIVKSYFDRVERYLCNIENGFKFNDYRNFSYLKESIENEELIYLLEWLREDNLQDISKFISNAYESKYDINYVYDVVGYQDYLIMNAMENNNYEGALDFLMSFISEIMFKTSKMSEIEENKDLNLINQSEILEQIDKVGLFSSGFSFCSMEHISIDLNNCIESAERQTFSI